MALWNGYVLLGEGVMVLLVKGYKYYSSLCPFSEDELVCSHRSSSFKRKTFSFDVCFKCPVYERGMLAIEEEDERVMAEIDAIRDQYSVG